MFVLKLLPIDKLYIASKTDVFPEPFFPQITVKSGSKLRVVLLWFLKEINVIVPISIKNYFFFVFQLFNRTGINNIVFSSFSSLLLLTNIVALIEVFNFIKTVSSLK